MASQGSQVDLRDEEEEEELGASGPLLIEKLQVRRVILAYTHPTDASRTLRRRGYTLKILRSLLMLVFTPSKPLRIRRRRT